MFEIGPGFSVSGISKAASSFFSRITPKAKINKALSQFKILKIHFECTTGFSRVGTKGDGVSTLSPTLQKEINDLNGNLGKFPDYPKSMQDLINNELEGKTNSTNLTPELKSHLLSQLSEQLSVEPEGSAGTTLTASTPEMSGAFAQSAGIPGEGSATGSVSSVPPSDTSVSVTKQWFEFDVNKHSPTVAPPAPPPIAAESDASGSTSGNGLNQEVDTSVPSSVGAVVTSTSVSGVAEVGSYDALKSHLNGMSYKDFTPVKYDGLRIGKTKVSSSMGKWVNEMSKKIPSVAMFVVGKMVNPQFNCSKIEDDKFQELLKKGGITENSLPKDYLKCMLLIVATVNALSEAAVKNEVGQEAQGTKGFQGYSTNENLKGVKGVTDNGTTTIKLMPVLFQGIEGFFERYPDSSFDDTFWQATDPKSDVNPALNAFISTTVIGQGAASGEVAKSAVTKLYKTLQFTVNKRGSLSTLQQKQT